MVRKQKNFGTKHSLSLPIYIVDFLKHICYFTKKESCFQFSVFIVLEKFFQVRNYKSEVFQFATNATASLTVFNEMGIR